jgi:hypothetical protein
MNFKGRLAIGTATALLALAAASHSLAQRPIDTNSPVRFQTQLNQEFATMIWDAGWASFQTEAGQLRFHVFLDPSFNNFCGVVLSTDSRQAAVQIGSGEFMYVPMCQPVLVPGSDPPVYNSCDGMRGVTCYTGSIPLNETLLRELATGQGEIRFHLPASGANGSYWEGLPPVKGRLLPLPGGDLTNALASLPGAPRSLTAVHGAGPVSFPPLLDSLTSTVDVDQDGHADYGLQGSIVCTTLFPSDCSTTFGLSCLASNQLLAQGLKPLAVPLGTSIGPAAPTNAAWGNAGMDSLTSTRSGSCYLPYTGELGRLGEAYLGVKLRRADGDHYGWMRVRLPKRTSFPVLNPTCPGSPNFPDPSGPGGMTNLVPVLQPGNLDLPSQTIVVGELSPVIEEWAYEPAPNTPILAGAKPFPVATSCAGVRRAGYLRLSFAGEAGRGYALQSKADLTTREWSSLGWLIISTASETVLDLPISGASGFYRVVEAE